MILAKNRSPMVPIYLSAKQLKDSESTALYAAKELQAVRALVLGIVVGKQMPDIPQRRRAEKRVGNGVKQNVRVGVPQQTHVVRNIHTAHDELPTRYQTVNVVAVTDPYHTVSSRSLSRKMASATQRSSRVVTLMFCEPHSMRRTGCFTYSTRELSSVASTPLVKAVYAAAR